MKDLFRRLQRKRRALEHVASDRQRALECRSARHDFVDQADPARLVRGNALGRQHQPHRLLHRHLARQALQRAAAERRESDPWLRQRELGVLRGDREVAGGDDFQAAAQTQSVHCGDHRLPKVEALGDSPEASRRIRIVSAQRERLEVGAHAKGPLAGAGDDRHPQVGGGGVEVEGPVQLEMRFLVQRVENFGTLDDDDQDGAILLQPAIPERRRSGKVTHGRLLVKGRGATQSGVCRRAPY